MSTSTLDKVCGGELCSRPGGPTVERRRLVDKYNPAYRVRRIMARASEQPGGVTAWRAWGATFGLSGPEEDISESQEDVQIAEIMRRLPTNVPARLKISCDRFMVSSL